MPKPLFEKTVDGFRMKSYVNNPEDYFGFVFYWLPRTPEKVLPLREILDRNYRHGGGWRPFKGFQFDPEKRTIKYPGDPLIHAAVEIKVFDETLICFPHAWFLVLQQDGTFEISRMD